MAGNSRDSKKKLGDCVGTNVVKTFMTEVVALYSC